MKSYEFISKSQWLRIKFLNCSFLPLIIQFFWIIGLSQGNEEDYSWGKPFNQVVPVCNITDEVKREISSYKPIADQIASFVVNNYKGMLYKNLELFVDTYGSRLSGSILYEEAIGFMEDKMKEVMSLNNAHSEGVLLPNWARISEEAYMITPRRKKVALVGLGMSISTPPEGITAPVIVIPTFKWLSKNKELVQGKIALFDLKGGNRRNFKLKAGRAAFRAGAIAVLGRSMVSSTIYTVSARSYANTDFPIPIANIANEDADLFIRLINHGEQVTLYLKMINTVKNVTSKNLMGDFMGRDDGSPEETVVITGHMDSWDISQGAQDNGCGSVLSMMVPGILDKLKLRPRRTIRVLLTVANEYNYLGARQYVLSHKPELGSHSALLMADAGCAQPVGYIYASPFPGIGCLLQEILKLMHPAIITNGTILITPGTHSSGDIFVAEGVPCVGLNGDAGEYYWVRHTFADTMSHTTEDGLDAILAFWATTTYIIADMKKKLIEFK